MIRWRIMRNDGRGSTTIVSDNLTKDMADDLLTVLSNAGSGLSYFVLEYEEARQHKEIKPKPHIIRECGMWLCGTTGGSYYGKTPVEAYNHWISARERNHGRV